MEKAEAGFASAFNVERLGREAISFNIEATTAECQYLAAQLDILGVSEMTAKGRLQRQPKSGLISVTGRIQTSVTQACVVTLEPVPQKVDTEFTVLFTFDKDDLEMEETDRVVGMDEQDLPDLIVDNRIDVAAVLSEQISLALESYPRSDGVAVDPSEPTIEAGTNGDVQEVYQPFANLRDLMNKK